MLRRAVGHRYAISIKTRLADILKCPEELWNAPAGRRLSQKHIDFVLYDPWTARIVAALELDDRSHATSSRRRRDRFVNQAFYHAGMVLLRVRAAPRYDVEALRAGLERKLNRPLDAPRSSIYVR